MYRRNVESLLKKALARNPVVLLNGARQVGKSTLASKFLKEGQFQYITFDDEITYLLAKNNPSGFIASLNKPVIIDEVQRVPEIFLAIKVDVDKHRISGRYLLTGSANPLLIPRLGDSLAGRMEVINLMPLSQGEILGHQETFIDDIFDDKHIQQSKTPLLKKELFEKIIIGGYPPVQNSDDETRDAWLRSYVSLILQRDIKDLAQIEKLTELPNLLRILAYRASNLLNVAEVSRECKMVSQTVHRYIALLQTIFLVTVQQSWNSNVALRYIKSPKLYLVDSGLLSYLLGITLDRALQEPAIMGKVVENFVVSELQKQITWSLTRPEMFHFRTSSGEEVDIILESRKGDIVGIEVKASESVSPQDFKGLTRLQEQLSKRFKRGILLYAGSQAVPFGKDLWALPISSLWAKL